MSPLVRRLARTLVFRVRASTARVRSPLFWRVLYGFLGSRRGAALLARLTRLAGRILHVDPVTAADRALPLFEVGWPHHLGTPWVNLHAQRIHRRVVRELTGSAPRPRRAPSPRTELRVGILGRLEDAFFFTRQFFAELPDGVTVLAFDLGSTAPAARAWVEQHVERYEWFSYDELGELARSLNAADLDLLLVDVRRPRIYELLDLLEVPCVAILCAEVHLRYHPTVSFHLYPFAQADYFPRDGRLFCGTTHRWFGTETIYPCTMPYDVHGLDPAVRRPLAERDPLLLLHGRLFKASDPYLDVVCRLLREDDSLQFVLMGQDSHDALTRIRAFARRSGVEERVHYEGPYTTDYDEHGELADPAWVKLFDLMSRARLAPDPWPLAAANTRVETYAAGIPAVHMGIRTDPESWGRPQPMVTAEHASLLIPEGTAYSPVEYLERCRTLLHDDALAERVVSLQAEVAGRATSTSRFWGEALAAYADWRSGAAGAVDG